jgi:hypothetical protein
MYRKTSSTPMNQASSRSHAVFTIFIETEKYIEKDDVKLMITGKVNLVDLAGSERLYKVIIEVIIILLLLSFLVFPSIILITTPKCTYYCFFNVFRMRIHVRQ